MSERALVSLSGGMDSATLLALAVNSGYEVKCIGFRYDSKHNKYELRAAGHLVKHYGVSLKIVDLPFMVDFKSDLMRSGGPIPEGHYESETMKQTVVPCRNMIFAAILAGYAESMGAEAVWLGVHSGDHAIYPDCRPLFLRHMGFAIASASDNKVRLEAPFVSATKGFILARGYALDNPPPYRLTRTCYKAQSVACGRCGSCQERLAAFADIGKDDPIEYESREILPK